MSAAPLAQAIRIVADGLGVPVRQLRALRSVSNSACLVDVDGVRAVLRLHTLDFGAPVNDHAREIEIHRLAASAGLAPPMLYSSVSDNILLTKYIEGGTFSQRGATTHRALAQIAECLARLHELALPETLAGYTLGEAADAYLRRAGVQREPAMRALARRVTDNEANADPADLALCHRDLLYSNILDCRPVMLIDWEFASPGERWFDLAALIAWHKLGARKQDAFISAYLGRAPGAAEREAVARNVAAFDALCTLWSLPAAGAN